MTAQHPKWQPAPQSTGQERNVYEGMLVADDESVQWHITHTEKGSYVSGWTITPKKQLAEFTD